MKKLVLISFLIISSLFVFADSDPFINVIKLHADWVVASDSALILGNDTIYSFNELTPDSFYLDGYTLCLAENDTIWKVEIGALTGAQDSLYDLINEVWLQSRDTIFDNSAINEIQDLSPYALNYDLDSLINKYKTDSIYFENTFFKNENPKIITDTLIIGVDTVISINGPLLLNGDTLMTYDRVIELLDNLDVTKTSFAITLPVAPSLVASVAIATFPYGWVLAADGNDLKIYHGTGNLISNVSINVNSSGTEYRQLRNFDNAYSGILNVDDNNVTIEGLTTSYTYYQLKINISF